MTPFSETNPQTSSSDAPSVLSILGTRPEVIKMAPVVAALGEHGLESRLCVTGQHRELLDQALDLFGLRPDHDLAVMSEGQDLSRLMARMLDGLSTLLPEERPDAVLVQGDTASALAGALAAFYAGIPVGHVEAGLRTEDWRLPFPEEAHRRWIDSLSTWCFAPTTSAGEHLRREAAERPDRRVWVTGNTVVDALQQLRKSIPDELSGEHRRLLGPARRVFEGDRGPVILVTLHRREIQGEAVREICRAVRRLAEARPHLSWIWPVHPNPAIRSEIHGLLASIPSIFLIEPMPYDLFVRLMERSLLILTDSGGVQEEAPSLGRPVLVAREITERLEGPASGIAKVIGTSTAQVASELSRLLDDPDELKAMTGVENPYGDGQAASRIARHLATVLGGGIVP